MKGSKNGTKEGRKEGKKGRSILNRKERSNEGGKDREGRME